MDEAEIADIFTALGPIRCRRMFGALGVYAEGAMFAIAAGDILYLKADAALAERLEAGGAQIFTYERLGRPVTLGFWSLPEAALDDADLAAELGGHALRLAQQAAASRRPARRRTARKDGVE
ncbi:DNA transformation protein [Ancylobacter aquaticus]|uniref:DNA transformation protein n=1 Tax=Ancylobacter aquaticus TaxID=100 RepID=A0A4R1I8B4_ANCAQ|nr:TfoX/Sxy family protein [Ancylobacter aquaticus]TCK31684.1 DNA transformation protein [Ancylobacter aquaticus]